MEAPISGKRVEEIAELAKINLSEQEIESFSNDLALIFNHLEKISQAEADQKILNKRRKETFFLTREDTAFKSDKNLLEKIINLFPEKERTFCKVPKIS